MLYRPSDSMTFTGRPEEFLPFINLFEHTIDQAIQDPVLKLKELLAACSTDVRAKLLHCQSLEPAQGYANAIRILWEDYGAPERILSSVLAKLRTGLTINKNDLAGLHQHHRNLQPRTRC